MSDQNDKIVYIVDDDLSVRQALEMLLNSAGFEARTFSSVKEFLNFKFREQNACLVTDVKMPMLSGLELQQKLIASGSKIPVIFITAFDTDETRNQARKAGAVAYLRKPVDDQALLDAIEWALSRQDSEEVRE